jgi:hypothetical protein
MDDEDKEDMYRIQFMQAFNLTAWDDDAANDIVIELYNHLKDLSTFKDLIIKAKQNPDIVNIFNLIKEVDDENIDPYIREDAENGIIFALLFNYEYFDLMHKCICDQLRNKQINPSTLKTFINKLSYE